MEIAETIDEARYINHAVTAQILRSNESPSFIKKNAAEVIASQKF